MVLYDQDPERFATGLLPRGARLPDPSPSRSFTRETTCS
jgi:hypothetical protein